MHVLLEEDLPQLPITARAQSGERLFYSAYFSLLLRNIKIFPGREVVKIKQQTHDTKTGRTEQDPPFFKIYFLTFRSKISHVLNWGEVFRVTFSLQFLALSHKLCTVWI
jgi:hypothetical protein